MVNRRKHTKERFVSIIGTLIVLEKIDNRTEMEKLV